MKLRFYILFLIAFPFSFVTFAKDLKPKVYTKEQCQILGLQPINFPNGEVLMPTHDGERFFVGLENKPATAQVTPEQVIAFFEKARSAGKIVHDLLSLQYVSDMPIILQKEIQGVSYEIGLSNLIFTPAENTLSLFALITTPDGNQLCFAGEQVGFTGQGGIKEGTLKLVLGEKNTIQLLKLSKIDLELTGGSLKFDCNGYDSFSIAGNVIFDRSLIVPENTSDGEVIAGNVKSAFVLNEVKDWNNMMIEISMQPFQLPNMKGYGFEVSNAVIDVSDFKNSPNCIFPIGYIAAETDNLWQGVYIGNVSVHFPKHFKNRSNPQRIVVGVSNLLIDRFGVSGEVFGENLMALKDGDLNGWDYSLDAASIVLVKSKVKAGSLGGKMRIAIADEDRTMAYKAIIDPTREYYNFSVATVDALEFSFLKASQVTLSPSSTVALTLENGEFSASAMLHGKLDITSKEDGIKLQQYTFEQLFVSTKAPYLSIGYFGGGSNQEHLLGNFPVTLIAPYVSVQNNVAFIEFGLGVNLDNIGISAKGGFVVEGAFVNKNNRHFWENKRFEVSQLAINADLNVGTFRGNVAFFKNDPVYGKGFSGDLEMTLKASSTLGVRAAGLFGRTTERYWFVDGELSSGGGGSGLSINILAGCFYKRMSPMGRGGSKSITGVNYVPDFGVGWGGRFAIGLSVGEALSGLAGLEIATHADGTLNKIGILGAISVAGSGSGQSPESAKQMYQQMSSDSDMTQPGGITNRVDGDPNTGDIKNSSNKFSSGSESGFGASIILKLNYDDRSFYGKIGANVHTTSIGLQAVGAFLFAPNKWFVHLGEPPRNSRILVQLPAFPTVDAYIMLGHGIIELPTPEPNIFTKYPQKNGKRNTGISSSAIIDGRGIAFGAALSVGVSGGYKNIVRISAEARAGLDMMLTHYGDGAYCEGREGQGIGINHWRAAGQLYVIGQAGVSAFGFDVLSLELGALLKGSAPNPTYGEGQVALNFRVLMKNYHINAGFQVGENCKVVGGDMTTETIQVIEGNYPNDGDQNIDKSINPFIDFIEKVESEVAVDGLNGSYKIKVLAFNLKTESGSPIDGSWGIDRNNAKKIAFYPSSTLPAATKIVAYGKIQLQKQSGGSWQPFLENGEVVEEVRQFSFITGKSPEEYKKDIEIIKDVAQEKAKDIIEETKETATQINEYAEQRAEGINEKATKEAKEINDEAKERGNKIIEKAIDLPEEKKKEVIEIVTVAIETVKKVTEDAQAKVKQITDKAVEDVKINTSNAVNEVNNTVTTALANVNNFSNDGKRQIEEIARQLNATINNLERERRNEIKWWMGRSRRNRIKEDYKNRVIAAQNATQIKMEQVYEAIKTQSDAEMAEAQRKSKEIMANAKARAEEIMNAAANKADAVMQNARELAKQIMDEAEKQCNNIINNTPNTDISVFAKMRYDNAANYDESDEGVADAFQEEDLSENPFSQESEQQKQAKIEEENQRLQEAMIREENQRKEQERREEQEREQRQQEEWNRAYQERQAAEENEQRRKEYEKQAEINRVEQERIQEEQRIAMETYQAEQKRIYEEQIRRERETYEAEQRRLAEEQQRIAEQQAFYAEKRRIAYEAEQEANRLRFLRDEEERNRRLVDEPVYIFTPYYYEY
ncbi:hypothetical protein [Emticicia sp. SJ17W-69]|uniref:hypothetical protein n=1 Tax=Emticicia sp. SJ17W-69 TaxID=3421657 RepID=UPI003EBB0C56